MLSMVRHWHRLHRETVGAPIPRGNHGQVGIHEQPELIEGVPAHGRGGGTGFKVFSNPSPSVILGNPVSSLRNVTCTEVQGSGWSSKIFRLFMK